MQYWLYRLAKEEAEKLDSFKTLEIDYLPEPVQDGDQVIVFISQDLVAIGGYVKKSDELILQTPAQSKDMRPLYEKLSFVMNIGPRTYKLFAKKVRMITKEDYELLSS